MRKISIISSVIFISVALISIAVQARNPFHGEGGTGDAISDSTLRIMSNAIDVTNSADAINFDQYFEVTDIGGGTVSISIDQTNLDDEFLSSSSATLTYEQLKGIRDYSVCISSPYGLGSIATLISPFRNYATTISSITAKCIGGTNVAFMIEQRTIDASSSAGTDIWTGDITASTMSWCGGISSDFTIPANSALFLIPTSVSGEVDRLMIKYSATRD